MPTYTVRYKRNNKPLVKKAFEKLYGKPGVDKYTNYYEVEKYNGSVIYRIEVDIEYDKFENRCIKNPVARIYNNNDVKIAAMEWNDTQYRHAWLYMNGSTVDKYTVLESNASEFGKGWSLRTAFKKLKEVWGFANRKWVYDDGRLVDPDGYTVAEFHDKYEFDTDFDYDSKDFLCVLLFRMVFNVYMWHSKGQG